MSRIVTPFAIDTNLRGKYEQFKLNGIFTKRQLKMFGDWLLTPRSRLIGNKQLAEKIGRDQSSFFRVMKAGKKSPLDNFKLYELKILLNEYNQDVQKKTDNFSKESKKTGGRQFVPFAIESKKRQQYQPFKKNGIFTKRQAYMFGNWIVNPTSRLVDNDELAAKIGKKRMNFWRVIKASKDTPFDNFTLEQLEVLLAAYNKDILKEFRRKSGTIDNMTEKEKELLKELVSKNYIRI